MPPFPYLTDPTERTLTFDLATAQQYVITHGIELGLHLIAAIALWVIGRRVIHFCKGLLQALIRRNSKLDPMLAEYLYSIVNVVLTGLLVLAILKIFGVQTTSFAALLAGLGLAIGTAWGGLLSHFAAGVFIQILRPFQIGDTITAGGVTGTVKELGLFGTTLISGDNVQTLVGNNTIFSGNISNYSATPYRRVDLTAKIANSVDPTDAINRLKAAVATVPNVLKDPAPDVGVLQFTPEGPLLFVRPFTAPANYWQVYCDTHRAILQAFHDAHYPIPATPTTPAAPAAPVAQPATAQ